MLAGDEIYAAYTQSPLWCDSNLFREKFNMVLSIFQSLLQSQSITSRSANHTPPYRFTSSGKIIDLFSLTCMACDTSYPIGQMY